MQAQDPGGTALALVTALIAQLRLAGLADLDQIEDVLNVLKAGEVTPQQVQDAEDALAVVRGLKGVPAAG